MFKTQLDRFMSYEKLCGVMRSCVQEEIVVFNLTCRFCGFSSSLGTMSIRKSNWSYFATAMAMSFLCEIPT